MFLRVFAAFLLTAIAVWIVRPFVAVLASGHPLGGAELLSIGIVGFWYGYLVARLFVLPKPPSNGDDDSNIQR